MNYDAALTLSVPGYLFVSDKLFTVHKRQQKENFAFFIFMSSFYIFFTFFACCYKRCQKIMKIIQLS